MLYFDGKNPSNFSQAKYHSKYFGLLWVKIDMASDEEIDTSLLRKGSKGMSPCLEESFVFGGVQLSKRSSRRPQDGLWAVLEGALTKPPSKSKLLVAAESVEPPRKRHHRF